MGFVSFMEIICIIFECSAFRKWICLLVYLTMLFSALRARCPFAKSNEFAFLQWHHHMLPNMTHPILHTKSLLFVLDYQILHSFVVVLWRVATFEPYKQQQISSASFRASNIFVATTKLRGLGICFEVVRSFFVLRFTQYAWNVFALFLYTFLGNLILLCAFFSELYLRNRCLLIVLQSVAE